MRALIRFWHHGEIRESWHDDVSEFVEPGRLIRHPEHGELEVVNVSRKTTPPVVDVVSTSRVEGIILTDE